MVPGGEQGCGFYPLYWRRCCVVAVGADVGTGVDVVVGFVGVSR